MITDWMALSPKSFAKVYIGSPAELEEVHPLNTVSGALWPAGSAPNPVSVEPVVDLPEQSADRKACKGGELLA